MPTEYAVYESVDPFFRREITLTPERIAAYLTDKYQREFYPVEEGGETRYVEAGREGIRIAVEFTGRELCEDYPQASADAYLAEGWQALGLEWRSFILETGQGRSISAWC